MRPIWIDLVPMNFCKKNRQNKYWPDKYVCLSRIDCYSTLVNSLIHSINSLYQRAPKQNHEYIELDGLLWCDHNSKDSVINARHVNNSKLVFILKKKKKFVIVLIILVCFFNYFDLFFLNSGILFIFECFFQRLRLNPLAVPI